VPRKSRRAAAVPDLEEFYDGFNDHPQWSEDCLTIPDKRGIVVPLKLSPAQARLYDAIQARRKAGRPVRIIYLKARQVHVTVGTAAAFFHTIPFNPGQHGMVVTHEMDATEQVFRYYKHFQDNYRPYRGLIELPRKTMCSQRGGLEWANGSYIHLATAKNLETGRSPSLRHLHLDEFAFWPDARRLMTALMQAVPDDEGTTVVIVSTANGVGNEFEKLWRQANDPQQESEWLPVFFGWWEHPEYARPLDVPADRFEDSIQDGHPVFGDEATERQKYNLSHQQLHWRRWCIANKCGHNVEVFRQEYPGNPNEAFLTSGRPRFPEKLLSRMPVIENAVSGGLEYLVSGTQKRLVFSARERGEVTLYRKPVAHRLYTIGGDVAEGIDAMEGAHGQSDPDWSVASVGDCDTGEQVAKFRARVEPAAFAEYLYALGEWFNWAYLVPEANGPGIAVLGELVRLGYPIQWIHKRRAEADVEGEPLLQKLGFRTTTITRPDLISGLDAALRDGSLIIRDPNTLQECRTFVIKANGRAEAMKSCHDDEVLAIALMVVGFRFAPRVTAARGSGPAGVVKYDSRRFSKQIRRGEPERLRFP